MLCRFVWNSACCFQRGEHTNTLACLNSEIVHHFWRCCRLVYHLSSSFNNGTKNYYKSVFFVFVFFLFFTSRINVDRDQMTSNNKEITDNEQKHKRTTNKREKEKETEEKATFASKLRSKIIIFSLFWLENIVLYLSAPTQHTFASNKTNEMNRKATTM